MKTKKLLALVLAMVMCMTLVSCGGKETKEKQEVQLFVAASLSGAMEVLEAEFEKDHPEIDIKINADGSGKLKTQIMEGFDANIFFSASETEIAELSKEKLIDDESVTKLLTNQLAIIGPKDYEGSVKDLATLKNAESIALPYGNVPAGFYTRKALIASDMLAGKDLDDAGVKEITGQKVGEALGGVEISEKDNVSTVLSAIAEKSCEVGLAYTSDTNRNEDVAVITKISQDLTGPIVYPICKVTSKEVSDDLAKAVDELFAFLTGDRAKEVYEDYGFTAM